MPELLSLPATTEILKMGEQKQVELLKGFKLNVLMRPLWPSPSKEPSGQN
jgi:hypothetical protein